MKKSRNDLRLHRKKRIRKKINGTAKCPRLCVFRSNKVIYAQLINDEKGVTLAQVDSRENSKGKMSIKSASEVGKKMAEKIKKLKVKSILFDRGGYKYHGKVKALAESLREQGIKF